MTTAALRLVELSGLSGVSAGVHLLAIRVSGGTAGTILVSRSTLVTGTAAAHLLDGGTAPVTPPTGGGGGAPGGHVGSFATLKRRKELEELTFTSPLPILTASDRKELTAFAAGVPESDDEELAVIMLLLL